MAGDSAGCVPPRYMARGAARSRENGQPELRRQASLIEPVRRADTLIVEATFLERDAALARSRGHLTAAHLTRLPLHWSSHVKMSHVEDQQHRDNEAETERVHEET